MKKIILILIGLYAGLCQAQIKFTNPIMSGFYPDPSVTKVGDDYYLVNSTFAYFPGVPVFHSKDLKNWKQIGNVIDRPSQMTFFGDRTSRGLFAPSINFFKGTYYMTCTNIDKNGNFVMTAKNPAGPWSNPVWLPKVRGIDPSLFFDQDKAYIVYNSDPPANKSLYPGHRTIRTFEFDPINLNVIGDEIQLVNGGVDISKKPVWIEGPHIFRRGDWYYLCAAEGGTSVNHSQVILRSKNATGPYVPYEKNPILTQRDLDPNRKDPITSAGHAELVEGPDGKTYAVFLAVRPYEGNHYNTGRETFIAPVKWEDGWPIINPDQKEIPYHFSAGFMEVKQSAPPQSGNFAYRTSFENKIDQSLLFLRTNDTSWYKLDKVNGLTMKLLPETCMGLGNPAFIGKRQQHLTSTATTEMTFEAKKPNEKAGMLIFQGEYNFYYICKSIKDGKQVVKLYQGNPKSKTMDLIIEAPITGKKVQFKIQAQREFYSFHFSDSGKWKLLKDKVDGKFLSTQTAGGFVGSLFALYATSSGEPSQNMASYKWLDYSGNDAVYNK
ncbi:MAG: glycoside hydrolase family 43 protein [Pedobacter sp.]|nr:MAG: glycoside hydrolase family 43 protein [Pedobacter sp.]